MSLLLFRFYTRNGPSNTYVTFSRFDVNGGHGGGHGGGGGHGDTEDFDFTEIIILQVKLCSLSAVLFFDNHSGDVDN